MRTMQQKLDALPKGAVLCDECDGDGYTGWSWGTKDSCSKCRASGWLHAPPPTLQPCMQSNGGFCTSGKSDQ